MSSPKECSLPFSTLLSDVVLEYCMDKGIYISETLRKSLISRENIGKFYSENEDLFVSVSAGKSSFIYEIMHLVQEERKLVNQLLYRKGVCNDFEFHDKRSRPRNAGISATDPSRYS